MMYHVSRILKHMLNWLVSLSWPFIEFCFLHLHFPERKHTLCILRLDRMGDYVLWRNFLAILRETHLFANHKIVLVGNIQWKELAELLDNKFVDKNIWIDKDRFRHPSWMLYKLRKLMQIRMMSYSVLLHPTFSRDAFSDHLVRLIYAREKIGQDGDTINQYVDSKMITDRFYTRLIPSDPNLHFEFDRNRHFFEVLLENEFLDIKPVIHWEGDSRFSDSVVIFPGAGHHVRRFGKNQWVALINMLFLRGKWRILIAGMKGELIVNEIMALLPDGSVTDLSGYNLSELLAIVKKALCVIAHDSAGSHLAMALHTPTVCVSNANQYKRFIPYPESYSGNLKVVYPVEFFTNYLTDDDRISKYARSSDLDITSIKPEVVVEAVCEIINRSGFVPITANKPDNQT